MGHHDRQVGLRDFTYHVICALLAMLALPQHEPQPQGMHDLWTAQILCRSGDWWWSGPASSRNWSRFDWSDWPAWSNWYAADFWAPEDLDAFPAGPDHALSPGQPQGAADAHCGAEASAAADAGAATVAGSRRGDANALTVEIGPCEEAKALRDQPRALQGRRERPRAPRAGAESCRHEVGNLLAEIARCAARCCPRGPPTRLQPPRGGGQSCCCRTAAPEQGHRGGAGRDNRRWPIWRPWFSLRRQTRTS